MLGVLDHAWVGAVDAIDVAVDLGAVGAEDAAGLDTGALMGMLGIKDGQLPTASASIHRLINAATPDARERLLVLFIGELFS